MVLLFGIIQRRVEREFVIFVDMKTEEIYKLWISTLEPLMGHGEAVAVTREALGHFLGLSAVDLVLKGDFEPGDSTLTALQKALKEIAAGRPVQYVTGEAWFQGMKLNVTPAVLIPRPETAQLVDIIVRENAERKDLNVIDLCTGSGAIAIALSRLLPFAQVTAVELSADALEVARANAGALNCGIQFIQADVLEAVGLPEGKFDIIVSNPPYIPENEKDEVDKNVLDNEPPMALFVPDATPIMFYEAIGRWASEHLNEGGRLYFEINPHFTKEITKTLNTSGFSDILVLRDSFGRERFITAGL